MKKTRLLRAFLLGIIAGAVTLMTGCVKNTSDSSYSGNAETSDNTNKPYMQLVDLTTLSGYVNQSYSTVKQSLDNAYKDSAYIYNGNEQMIVYVQDSTIPDRYYALMLYESGGNVYAVTLQNINDMSTSDLWDKALELADTTSAFAGSITSGNIYNGSSVVYSATNYADLKYTYQINKDLYNAYSLEIDWNNSSKSHAVLITNGKFYWIAQKGAID